MVDNILQNEQHYAKVAEERQQVRDNQGASLNTWFWFGVIAAIVSTGILVGTYMARHDINAGETNQPAHVQATN